MSRKKGTVVDLSSLQNMFEPLDIKIPSSTSEDKPKQKYRNRRYDDAYNSSNKGYEDNDFMTTSWRASTSRTEPNDEIFENIRKPTTRDMDSELNDESWANLRNLSRDNTSDHWRDSFQRRSNYGSKKTENVDTRPERLKLKLLPKGAKARSESSKSETPSQSFKVDKEHSIDSNKLKSDSQITSISNSSDTHEDDSKLDPALKSRMVAIRKQKELDEACKNEILSYNALFNCDNKRAKLVLDATIQVYEKNATDYNRLVEDVRLVDKASNDCFETIVPSIVALSYITCKLSDATTLEEASDIMNKVKGWLKHLLVISKIENHETHLLNQASIICNYWNLPSLNTNLFLIEALFDSLYCCGIISHSSFVKWFEDDSSEIPARITVMYQDEDLDIEALVPKRVELNGRKPTFAY